MPPLLPFPVPEPPLLELTVPELLNSELPPDPELPLLAAGVKSAELPSPAPVFASGLPPPKLVPPPDSDPSGTGPSLISRPQAITRAAAPTNQTRLMILKVHDPVTIEQNLKAGRQVPAGLIDPGSAPLDRTSLRLRPEVAPRRAWPS
jgi:hypothetical protein